MLQRYFSLLPLPARDPDVPHRAATPLELFFDLISVVAIAAITAGLHHAISEGHGVEKLPIFAFLFIGIWWAWMNFTWFASAFDNDGPFYRTLVMVLMGGEVLFAGGAAYMFETGDFSWGILGWTVMRVAMAVLWFRAAGNMAYRKTCLRYGFGVMFAQLLWIAFYVLTVPGSPLFYAAGIAIFLVEFAVPLFAERARQTPFHRHHMIERYGLLTIISLGEVVLAISLGFGALYGEHAAIGPVITAVAALVLVFCLFSLYFCKGDHLVSSDFATAFSWGYGHLLVFGSIAAIGAGIAAELDLATHHSHTTQDYVAWWMGGPLAVYFLSLWFVRDRYHSLGNRQVALPVMALVALIASFLGSPSWMFALIAFGALVWRVPPPLASEGQGMAEGRHG
ncbi:low temperature requirement protein A [Henriciella sp. AS95]|uniref:low temperature requirement protein A n=1 Tax=Henriciella sp. AS95 TaxID=3135782 RepID=UPI00317D80A9